MSTSTVSSGTCGNSGISRSGMLSVRDGRRMRTGTPWTMRMLAESGDKRTSMRIWTSGLRLNIKMIFSGVGFHYKDKTVVRPSYLYNGNSLASKTVSLNWEDSQNAKHDVGSMTGWIAQFICWNQKYAGITMSITWLMTPWLLASPGHQQRWYDCVNRPMPATGKLTQLPTPS